MYVPAVFGLTIQMEMFETLYGAVAATVIVDILAKICSNWSVLRAPYTGLDLYAQTMSEVLFAEMVAPDEVYVSGAEEAKKR